MSTKTIGGRTKGQVWRTDASPDALAFRTTVAERLAVSKDDTAETLMSRPVYRVSVKASAEDAARLMWEHDVGIVPVVDGDDRLVGVVTDRDLTMATYLGRKHLWDIPVDSVMSADPRFVLPTDPINRAATLMARGQIRRIPVMDHDRRLIGMLSLNDLAGASVDPKCGAISDHGLAQTLRAICAARRSSE